LPDIGSIGLSFSMVLGLMAQRSVDAWVPFSRNQARGRQVGGNHAEASHKDAVRNRSGASPSLAS
jgi:hypothetical protein